MHHGKDAAIFWMVGPILAACFTAGCSSFQLRWGARSDASASNTEADMHVATELQPPPPVPGDDLASIEDFLRRTEQYRAAPAPPSDSVIHRRVESPAVAASTPAAPSESKTFEAQVPNDARSTSIVANGRVALEPPAPTLALPVLQSITVHSSVPLAAPPKTEAVTKTTNQAIDTSGGDEPVTVDRLLNHLANEAQNRGDFESEWRLRLVALAFDHPTPQHTGSSKLSSDARQILDALAVAATAARRVAQDPIADGKTALVDVERLVEVISERADPVIQKVMFCRKVATFGVYDEIAIDSLRSGRAIPVIVYTEVANLHAARNEEGRFRTALASRLELLTADGHSVWQQEESEITDLCRQRRKDFFVAQRVTLPATLAAGDYVLKVLVEDKLSGKATEATYPFTIFSPAAVARR